MCAGDEFQAANTTDMFVSTSHMHIRVPDVVTISWMKGQWLAIGVITLLGWLDIRIIRSTHIECSVTGHLENPIRSEYAEHWPMRESFSVSLVSPADYLSLLLTQELSTRHRSVSLLMIFLRSFIWSNEILNLQCLDDVRLSWVSQVYITTIALTITQT